MSYEGDMLVKFQMPTRKEVEQASLITLFKHNGVIKEFASGMKINSPDLLLWEVEATHIVPHNYKGKDDLCNGLALCRLHHWAFDVGWITLTDNFIIQVSSRVDSIPNDYGRIGNYDFIKAFSTKSLKIFLPSKKEVYPHPASISWHRENIFYK